MLLAAASVAPIACAPENAGSGDQVSLGPGSATTGAPVAPRDAAIDVIRIANVFSTGPFGEGAERLHEIDAFAMLIAQPDAPRIFQKLLGEATPSGRAYSLCGLWLTDQPSYVSAAAQLAADGGVVEYYPGGCVGWGVPLNELIEARELRQSDISSGSVPQALQAYAVGQI